MSKTRYRFSHQADGTYYWYGVSRVSARDSRYELITCPVGWFWGVQEEPCTG